MYNTYKKSEKQFDERFEIDYVDGLEYFEHQNNIEPSQIKDWHKQATLNQIAVMREWAKEHLTHAYFEEFEEYLNEQEKLIKE